MITISATPVPDPKNNNIVTVIYAISLTDIAAYIQSKGAYGTIFATATISIINGAASSDVKTAILDFFKLSESEGRVDDFC